MVHAIVAHADGPDFSLLDALDEALPGGFAHGRAAVGGVEEHEVDVVETRDLEGLVDLFLGGFIGEGAAGDFGGEEDLVAGDLGADLADGGAAAGFVLVNGCRVDLFRKVKYQSVPLQSRDSTACEVVALHT